MNRNETSMAKAAIRWKIKLWINYVLGVASFVNYFERDADSFWLDPGTPNIQKN
jgi:hypothetical protein